MNQRRGARRYDQADIRGARERCDGTLDLASVARVNGAQFHSEPRRHPLDRGQLPDPSRNCCIPKDRYSRHAWRDLFEQFQPFLTLMPYSNTIKPVALPPGRAMLSTKPAPTGSATCVNTIGTVRVACSNDARAGVLLAWMR